MKYITSDLHLRHERIHEFCPNRPGDSIEEMEEIIINEINNLPNCSLLYILGDFYFGRSQDLQGILDRIRPQVIHVWGNHDYKSAKRIIDDHKRQSGFDYKETSWNKIKVCMSHFPMLEWHGQHKGALMLHGHCHGRLPDIYPGRRLDVGYDAHNRILRFDEACEMAFSKELWTPYRTIKEEES